MLVLTSLCKAVLDLLPLDVWQSVVHNQQVLCIRKPEEAIDLFMVEIMHMRHKFDVDTRLVSIHLLLYRFQTCPFNNLL